MRKNIDLDLRKPPNLSVEDWIGRNLSTIMIAAQEDAAIDSADAFGGIDHNTYAPLESFDPNTVTTQDLARAFATFLKHLQNHGPRR